MKDVGVILVKPKKSWLGKLITTFTHGEYSHCAVVFENKIYEDAITIDRNNQIYNGIYENDQLIGEYWKYKGQLSEYQKVQGREFLQNSIGKKYGLLKLFLMIFIYPTRWFWNKIGIIPFKRVTKGIDCADFVDNFYMSMGIDLLPGLRQDLSIPDDFSKSPLLEREI